MTAGDDLMSSVRALEDAANRHAIDEVMAMFADDVVFELVGLARLVDKAEIRRVFEYDAGVHGKLQLVNCVVRGDSVGCQLVERNDRLREAGLEKMVYPSCVLEFRNTRIRSWRAVPDPEALLAFDRFWGTVRRWIAENHPADHARIFTPDGRFIRNRGNGARAVQLATEYRSARARPERSSCDGGFRAT